MSTKANNTYSSPKNINLREGILRFDVNHTSNPLTNDSLGWGLYINSSNQLVYWNKTSAAVVSGTSTAGSMDAGYDLGQTITVDNGAIVLNDASVGAANVLEFNKTGAGSGNILDFDFTAAFTGNVLNLDMGSAVAAVGMVIDSEGGARTGTDLLFTDDSTGASHYNIVVNKSGAGTGGIAFTYTGSYNGSPAGQIFNLTFDDGDNLDTEIEQIATGTGNRGIMFDYNFGHADAGTTSHIWDIDVGGILDSNVFDVAFAAASTGNVFYINLDNAVAETALHVEGSGARTQPMIEVASDATGSAHLIEVVLTGAISGNVFDISLDTTSTGDVLNVDMNASVGGRFLFLDAGNAIRTADLIAVTMDGSGNKGLMLVSESNTGSGHLIDVNVSGIGSGNVLDITYSAADTGDALSVVMADNVGGGALVVTGAGARTDSLIDVLSAETGSVDGMVYFGTSGVFTGSILTVHSDGAATTGALVHLDLDAGVAYKAMIIDHAGARTSASVLVTFDGTVGAAAGGTFLDANISMTGAGANPFIDIDISAAYVGNVLDILYGADVGITGTAIKVDLGATATSGVAMNLVSGAMTRTTALVKIDEAGTPSGAMFDINLTGAVTGNIFEIDTTAATTGNIFDVGLGAADTGNVINIDMNLGLAATAIRIDAGGGIRTQPLMETIFDGAGDTIGGTLWDINVTNTGATASPLFDIDVTGVYTGNIIDIVFGNASASTGDALHVDMGTNLAGNAIQIDAAGARTAPLIYVANTGTDAGTDDHVLFIYQTGLLDSNLVNLEFATAASTGNALSVAMGTNVAGMALDITSAGTGVSNEGSAINITHTGTLVAGADVVRISQATGVLSSTSNVLAVEAAGNSTAGSFAVYINASGTGIEALKVDAGTVTFDETLTVTGACTFSSSITYLHKIEDVTTTNIITAAESGTVYFLDSITEFVTTLPAVATSAGVHYTFIVKAAPSGADYTIVTDSSENKIIGLNVNSAGAAGDTGTTDDTISFVGAQSVVGDKVDLYCDGAFWYAYAISAVAAGITFTTAS